MEAEIPGFFVRLNAKAFVSPPPTRRAATAEDPSAPVRYVVAQVDRAKVLLQGSRTIVGLYVNPGDNNMLTIKVWGPCLLAGPRVKAACFKM